MTRKAAINDICTNATWIGANAEMLEKATDEHFDKLLMELRHDLEDALKAVKALEAQSEATGA